MRTQPHEKSLDPRMPGTGPKNMIELATRSRRQAERDGIVIVNSSLTFAYLRNCPRLVVTGIEHGRRLRQSLKPTWPHVDIRVDDPAQRKHAA